MGHLRLGTLPQSKKWRDVVELLGSETALDEIAAAAARASDLDLSRAARDATFQNVVRLLTELPLRARSPDFHDYLHSIGLSEERSGSVPSLLAALDRSLEAAREHGSDLGAMSRAALVESLSVQLRDRLPSLFDPTPQEVRTALAAFSSGKAFATLARDFFSRLTYRSLDYYLSRELAAHTGAGQRFASDADRTAFQQALATHVYEASRIVEDFAGGWYGKTVWQRQALDSDAVDKFASYAFKKLRSELGRRRASS